MQLIVGYFTFAFMNILRILSIDTPRMFYLSDSIVYYYFIVMKMKMILASFTSLVIIYNFRESKSFTKYSKCFNIIIYNNNNNNNIY